MFGIDISCLLTFPIEITRYISSILWLFKVFKRTFASRSQTRSKNVFWSFVIFIILGSRSSIIHENIRVSTASIALIVVCRRISLRRWARSFNLTIVTIKMHTMIAKICFAYGCQSTLIHYYLLISSCSIPKVADVFGVESSLHAWKSTIRLRFTWKIHFIF